MPFLHILKEINCSKKFPQALTDLGGFLLSILELI